MTSKSDGKESEEIIFSFVVVVVVVNVVDVVVDVYLLDQARARPPSRLRTWDDLQNKEEIGLKWIS